MANQISYTLSLYISMPIIIKYSQCPGQAISRTSGNPRTVADSQRSLSLNHLTFLSVQSLNLTIVFWGILSLSGSLDHLNLLQYFYSILSPSGFTYKLIQYYNLYSATVTAIALVRYSLFKQIAHCSLLVLWCNTIFHCVYH